ncbi:sensor histidine kinase [Cohnella caldifontis]|uniref:sensor histidine kinase n=1 Tax=Cohnella caldifontis TaxID=3027471 RepID=UPI0023ED6F22|nr:sensor histidine kinase [Cohnella sp. YIM B05605]
MRFTAVLLASLILVLSGVALPAKAASKPAPRAVAGFLDLRGESFRQSGMANLDGEWAFYWNNLLTPELLHAGSGHIPAEYAEVPAEWSFVRQPGVSNQGHATYLLNLRLDERDANRVMAIHMPGVASAYRLWINGALAADNGTVGTSRMEMSPKKYAKVVTFVPRSPDIELVLQVSNYVQRKGGLTERILFGYENRISAERDKRTAQEFAVFGGLLLMGIYHFGLYAFRRSEKSTLYFGIFCLLIALRSLLVGETFLVGFFPDLPWELAVKLEYWPNTLAVPVFVWFVHSQYPLETHRHARAIALALSLPFTLLILLAPANVYTRGILFVQLLDLLTCLYCVYVFVKAAIRLREGAVINLAAMVVFTLLVLNEVLYTDHIDWIGRIANVSAGFYVYLFAQSVILSMRFSKSFAHVQLLSNELADLNASLEQKVKERTEALEKMDQARRSLLSHISHELRTPLTSIQGYVKGMIDGVVPAGDLRIAAGIYDRTQWLRRIIDDLFELTKLEAGQARFEWQTVEFLPFIRQLCDKYKSELQDSGLEFRFADETVRTEGRPLRVKLDPIRIEQVLANLLTNAVKFTPAGGKITVKAVARENEATIQVIDTGRGIDEEELPYIFQRFYQGSATRKSDQGAGLGLVIAKEIVEKHGGTIGAAGKRGEGSTVFFTLPLLRGE